MNDKSLVLIEDFKSILAEVKHTNATNTRNPHTDWKCRIFLEERGDEILSLASQLAAEVIRLREALLPFAEYADECDEYRYDDFNQAPVTAGDCRQARAALNETQERNDDQ